jgi:hypothetical protein
VEGGDERGLLVIVELLARTGMRSSVKNEELVSYQSSADGAQRAPPPTLSGAAPTC